MHDDCVASMIVLSMMGLPLLLLVLQCACHVTATVTHRLELETCIGMDRVGVCMCVSVHVWLPWVGAFASDTCNVWFRSREYVERNE